MVRFCDLDFTAAKDGSVNYKNEVGKSLFRTLRVFEFDQVRQSQSVVVQLGNASDAGSQT